MMKHTLLVWPCVAFLVFAGCATDRSTGATNVRRKLVGTDWVVESIGDKPVILTDVRERLHLKLSETDSKVAAHGGVNRFGGSYKVDSDKLTFGPMISTKMAGPAELNTQEAAFASAFAKVNGYTLSDNTLTLKQDQIELMTLTAK